jgi:hypothetical protein
VPRRNRVTPTGELIAVPERGLVHGNRGCLHDDEGHIRRAFAVRRWIACRLEFRRWRRSPLMQPGRYTELFFLDDATALAAGHRPCALCRREDYRVFLDRWRGPHPTDAGADALDARLHVERLDGRGRRLYTATIDDLPDGVMILRSGEPFLVRGDRLWRWTPGGYTDPVQRTSGTADVLTPASTVEVLHGGWEPVVPFIHPSAAP